MEHKDFFYGTLFYQLSVPIVILDARLEIVVDANESALRHLDVRASEVLNRKIVTLPKIDLCGTAAPEMSERDVSSGVDCLTTNIEIEILGTFSFKEQNYIVSMLVTNDTDN